MYTHEVSAIAITTVAGHRICIYYRSSHGNDYIKVVRGTIRGKFRLDLLEWVGTPDIDSTAKKEIKTWITKNIEDIRRQIKELV